MRKVFSPVTLRGLDKGGFLVGRVENDGCTDHAMRARLRKNCEKAGTSLGGGVFVPGLCRKGVPEDPYAVVHSRSEVIKKARELGREVHGPDMDVETPIFEEHLAKAESPYRANEQIGIDRAIEKVKRDHGGSVSRKKFRDIVQDEIEIASGNG